MMNYGDDRTGLRIRGKRAGSFWAGAMLILGLVAAPDLVRAADAPVGDQAPMQAPDLGVSPVATIAPARTRSLSLGVGKSVVIDLPREVKDVLVADPKIANAVIRSAQRAYIIGGTVGQTNVVFFTADGQQVAAYDIAVKRDLNGMRTALRSSLPGVQIEGVGDSVMLTGSVSSPVEAQQAGDVAAKLVGGAGQGRQQHRRARPRPGDAEGRRRRSPPRHRQAIGRRSQRQPERRHRGGEFQQFQPVLGQRRTAGQRQRARRRRPHQGRRHRQRHDARDGKRRRDADAGRAEPDRDLR